MAENCRTLYGTIFSTTVVQGYQTVTQTITEGANPVTSVNTVVNTVCSPSGNSTDCSTSTGYQTFTLNGQGSTYTQTVVNTVQDTQTQTFAEPTATQCNAVAATSSRPTPQAPISVTSASSTLSHSTSSTSPSSSSSHVFSTHYTTAVVVVTDEHGSSTTSSQVTQMLVPQVNAATSAQHSTSMIVGSTIGALFACLFVAGLALGFYKGVGPFKRLRRGDLDDGIDDMVWMPPDHDRDEDEGKVHPPQRTLSYRSHGSDSFDHASHRSADLGRQPSTAHTHRPMSQISEGPEWHTFGGEQPQMPTFTRQRSWIGPLPPISAGQPLNIRPMSNASSFYGPEPEMLDLYGGLFEEPNLRPTSPEMAAHYQRLSRRISNYAQPRPPSVHRQSVAVQHSYAPKLASRPPSMRTPTLNVSSDSLSSCSSAGPLTPVLGGPEPNLIMETDESNFEEIGSPREIAKTFTLRVVGDLPSPDVSPIKKVHAAHDAPLPAATSWI